MSRRLSLLLVALLAAAAPFHAAAEDLPVPDAAQEQQVRGYLAGLRSKDANVVHMAKRLLGRVDNVHRVVPWCEVLRGAREVAWRTRAAAELASFGDVRARDPLVAAATADRSADVRVAARVSLQSLRAPGTTQALARQLTNASTDVRVHAIEALAEQDDPLAAPERDPDEGEQQHEGVGHRRAHAGLDVEVRVAEAAQDLGGRPRDRCRAGPGAGAPRLSLRAVG